MNVAIVMDIGQRLSCGFAGRHRSIGACHSGRLGQMVRLPLSLKMTRTAPFARLRQPCMVTPRLASFMARGGGTRGLPGQRVSRRPDHRIGRGRAMRRPGRVRECSRAYQCQGCEEGKV